MHNRAWRLSAADTIIAAIMLGALCLGVGRFVVVAGAVASNAATERDTPLTAVLDESLRKDPAISSWWGGRFIPRPKGDDYLKVLTERSALRTLGPALGTVAERQRALGVTIEEVFVPEDNDALLGGKTGTVYTTADGGQTSTGWAPVGRSAANFTDVPFVTRDYDPVLSESQVTSIEASTTLPTVTRDIRVAGAVEGGSGTWILYSHPTERASEGREFLLIPIELDPRAGAL